MGDNDAKSAQEEGHTGDIDDSLELWHTLSVSGALFTFESPRSRSSNLIHSE